MSAVRADVIFLVERGSSGKYWKGTQEASSPADAWRARGYVATAWPQGPAPLGYSQAPLEGPFGTDLSLSAPAMEGHYSSVFLRREFQVLSPSSVLELNLNVDYDDGFVAWINGVEIARSNVNGGPGAPVAFDDLASTSREPGAVQTFELPDPAGYLVGGVNVLAVQAFNASVDSDDFKIDVELVDPLGPDVTPPVVKNLTPPPGATVASLTQLRVVFSEPVTGVTAGDVRVQGAPASAVSGAGAGPYVFTFAEPAPGGVNFAWAGGHGISDSAAPPNFFSGGNWSYTLDPAAPAASVSITELLAANATGLRDENQERQDWIEVCNVGADDVNLDGYGLTDDPGDPFQWTFPAVLLPQGECRVVFASGKDRKPTDGKPLHTSFKLNPAGEYLALYAPEAPPRLLSEFSPRFPPQRADFSYGIDFAGGAGYFEMPTPGVPNGAATPVEGFTAEPVVAPGRGFYTTAVQVTISSPTPGAAVYYTLDGSEPDPATGTAYSGSIVLAGDARRGAQTLRAAAWKEGQLPSNVVTHTFIFPADVLTQPQDPDGFPVRWGVAQAADYAVDPDVVNNPAYAAQALDALLAIPTVSIVTSVNNLFHASTGIYANPSREGVAWERPVSAEILYADGSPSVQVDCGLRIQGGSSTEDWKALKVSMRLLFKDDYGRSKLEGSILPDSEVRQYDTLVLDAGLNLTWNHPSHDQRVRSQYVRDQYVSDLQNSFGGHAPAGIFVHLYLDGLYWGLYGLHERPDASYAAEHFGGNKSEYDVLKHTGSEVISGSAAAWNAMMAIARSGLSQLDKYEALKTTLDVEGLADYMLANIYSGNDDWPRHNWYATRRRAAGELFRFHSWDAEHVLKDATINVVGAIVSNSPAELFSLLRQNAEFRLLCADRAQRHFSQGGPLYVDPDNGEWDPQHPERNRPAADYGKRIAEIDPAIILESARWGDVRRPLLPYTRNVEWQAELDWLLGSYFPQRSRNVINQLRASQLLPAVGAPVFSRAGGVVPPGATLELVLGGGPAGTMYYTLDGSDPRSYGSGGVSPAASEYAEPISLSSYPRVKARTLSGAVWSALSEAEFRSGLPLDGLRISEIHYHPPEGGDHEFLEIANAGAFAVDLSGVRFTEGVSFEFGPGATIAVGQRVVVAANAAAFEADHPGVPLAGVFAGSLDNSGEAITLSDRDGAPIVTVRYHDDELWPLAADGLGFSLVLEPLDADPDLPESWRTSGARGGSPGEADAPSIARGIVLNEVLSRSSPPFEEAVEIANLSGFTVSIAGWYLSDRRDGDVALKKLRIPAGTTLASGGFAVFYRSQLEEMPGAELGFVLDPHGGAVYLASADAAGQLTGHVVGLELGGATTNQSYGRTPTSRGATVAPLLQPTFGVDAPASVDDFRSGRGAPNAPPATGPVVINEIHYHPLEGEFEFVELYNPLGEAAPLFDEASGRGWRLRGVLNASRTDEYEFSPGEAVPARGYLVISPLPPATFRALYAVPAASRVAEAYGGALDNSGERIQLLRPDPLADGSAAYVPVDQVRYDDRSPWPVASDGHGPSLERIMATVYGNEPDNWGASAAAGGTPGRPNDSSPPPGDSPPSVRFTASPVSGKAPLEVHLDASGTTDSDGDVVSYAWTLADGSSASGALVTHVFASAGAYVVTLRATDDAGGWGVASRVVTVGSASSGLQVPGDCNQDSHLDLADAICILFRLFVGPADALPCGVEPDSAGNRSLLDASGDGKVDVSDAVRLLHYLFLSGPPPALGTDCTPIAGCPDACAQ